MIDEYGSAEEREINSIIQDIIILRLRFGDADSTAPFASALVIFSQKEYKNKIIYYNESVNKTLFNVRSETRTLNPADLTFPTEKEHNISLKTTPTAPSKLPTATSLNNNIHRLRPNLKKCSHRLK